MSFETTVRPGEVQRPQWEMSQLAWEIYRSLGPLTYPDRQLRDPADPNSEKIWPLAALVEAWTTVEGWLEEAARPEPGTGEVPWSKLLAPWGCPWWALRWCGQVYGLRLEPELGPWARPTEEVEHRWRLAIENRLAWHRGHPDAILAAARRFTKSDVQLRERYDPALGASVDAPWHLQVLVRSSAVRSEYLTGRGPAANLIANPSAEGPIAAGHVRVAGTRPGTVSRDTSWHASGTASYRLVVPSPSEAGSESAELVWPNHLVSDAIPVRPGETISWSMEYRVDPASTAPRVGSRVRWILADGSESYRPPESYVYASTGRLTGTVTVPADAVGCVVNAGQSSTDVGQTFGFAVDDLIVARGPSVPTYADGDTPGWEWDGVPRVSTSSRPSSWDAPEIRRAVLGAVPLGIGVDVVVTDDRDYDQVARDFESYAAFDSPTFTYTDLQHADKRP